jgi:hypothetical protein
MTTYALLGGLPWQWWTIGLLILIIVVVLEGGHAAIVKRESEHEQTRRELADVRDELRTERDRSRPKFKITFGRVGVFPGKQPPLQHVDTMAQMEVIIANSGSPSIATDFDCELHYKGQVLRLTFWVFGGVGSTVSFHNKAGEPIIKLTPQDLIQEKTVKPIQTGDRTIGWALLQVMGIEAKDLTTPDTKLVFSCADVVGTRYSGEYRMTGLAADKPGYIQGGVLPMS